MTIAVEEKAHKLLGSSRHCEKEESEK